MNDGRPDVAALFRTAVRSVGEVRARRTDSGLASGRRAGFVLAARCVPYVSGSHVRRPAGTDACHGRIDSVMRDEQAGPPVYDLMGMTGGAHVVLRSWVVHTAHVPNLRASPNAACNFCAFASSSMISARSVP